MKNIYKINKTMHKCRYKHTYLLTKYTLYTSWNMSTTWFHDWKIIALIYKIYYLKDGFNVEIIALDTFLDFD